METTDLVERVARALYQHEWQGQPHPDGFASDRTYWMEAARAALEAAGVPALQARVEKLEGLAIRTLEALDRATCSIESQPPRDEARQQADEARAALAEDYCGIVEVNEEDFKAEGEKG